MSLLAGSFVIDGRDCDDSASIASANSRRSIFFDVGDALNFNPSAFAGEVTTGANQPIITPEPDAPQESVLPPQKVDLVSIWGFDPAHFVHGPRVNVCKEVYYQGHACTVADIEQATNMVDYIAQRYESEDCMPFAVRLVEGGELLTIAQDNGDFMGGVLVGNALKRLDGYNVFLCVTRYVKGFFVAEMVQAQKRGAVKQAAEKTVELMLSTLKTRRL